MNKTTVITLREKKHAKQKLVMLTAYDASIAKIAAEAGVDVILVGDSLGNVVQGLTTTLPVTLEDMIYHTRCVARAPSSALLVVDLPFMSYSSPEQALQNAAQLMRAGAEMVKLEGGACLSETVKALTQNGIPVCAHLGLTPQSVHVLGGYHVQGRDHHHAQHILKDAIALSEAGAKLLVLECVPSILAEEITLALNIPVIGIGAGPYCDGQVLVVYDMLGITTPLPKFAMNFLSQTNSIQSAIVAYVNAVKQGDFPTEQHGFS